MKIKVLSTISIIVLMIAFMVGCSRFGNKQPQEVSQDDKLTVYATIYPMYDFAKNIGKDKINLKQVIPAGMEPHDWEPTAKSIAEMKKTDVFIYNGAGIEPWVEKLIGSLENKDLIIVNASQGIELLKGGEYEEDAHEGQGQYDPHVWLDPTNAVKQAENIKNALIKADEKNKDFYEANYKEFIGKLDALDQKYKEQLASYKGREIVVAHEAFGYLTKRYGLEQIAVKGITPEEEPSPARMVEITKLIKDKKIKYVFFETMTSPRLSEVLARETGAKTAVLNPIEGLTEEEAKSGKNYMSIMEDNLNVLKKALGDSL